MSRDEHDRLRDIKDAITTIRGHLAKATGDDNPLLHDALLFQFVVIGEAVKHLAPETREAEPSIPWDVAGLRDLIAHEYFRIEVPRILAIVERDLTLSSKRSNDSSASKGRRRGSGPARYGLS